MVRVVRVVATTCECHRKVEPEAVDVALLDPVPQGVQDQERNHRVAQIEGVAASRHVDVTSEPIQAVVGAVVQPPPRQGRSGATLLAGVVVDDVENDLKSRSMEQLDHALELVKTTLRISGSGIRGLRRRESQSVVAPMILESSLHQLGLVAEGMDRQELDRSHAQCLQVGYGGGVRHPGIRPAQPLRDLGMALGEVADVSLVDDRLSPRHLRRCVVAPVEAVVDDDGPGNVCRAVAEVPDVRVAPQLRVDNMAEHLWAPAHLAFDRTGAGIQQQLVGVVPQTLSRQPRPERTHAVSLSRADPGNGAEPGPMSVPRQVDPDLAGSARVTGLEETDLDLVRVSGKDGEIHTIGRHGGSVLRREIAGGAHGHQRRQSLR